LGQQPFLAAIVAGDKAWGQNVSGTKFVLLIGTKCVLLVLDSEWKAKFAAQDLAFHIAFRNERWHSIGALVM
jgi:hypothetical protein